MSVAIATDQPCERCGSSDAKAYYQNGSYCFACTYTDTTDTYDASSPIKMPKKNPEGQKERVSMAEVANIIGTGDYQSIVERKLSPHTCRKYSCLHTGDRTYFGYYDTENNRVPVAAKVRYPGKKFQIVGKWDDTTLFGQNAFTTGTAKYITICEGEFDAMAAYQMTGSEYPVVSLRNGAQSAKKDCQKQIEWLMKFERIYICFDSDEHGQKAAKEVAELFGNKAYIFKHEPSMKDACDYLKAGKTKEFVKLWFQAQNYYPEEIINGSELWEQVKEPPSQSLVLYPFTDMNKITYGIRMKELVTICAGSGLGKTQFMREIIYHLFKETDENIGLLMLEESAAKTAESLMSLELSKPLHLPVVKSTTEERREAFDATLGTGRFLLFEHFGSTEIDTIISAIRCLATGAAECKYIFLDHVTMVVSAQSNNDERQALDELMTKLRTLVQEVGICLFCISHLKRPNIKGHEDGGLVSLSQLRGSGAIAHLSDLCIGLERNGQAENEEERNTTNVRILKNRFSGLTGSCASIHYDSITGRMKQTGTDYAM